MAGIMTKAAAGVILGGGLLFTGGMGLAGAQPVTNVGEGLVNVGIGNVTVLRNVNVEVAAAVAAAVCPSVDAAAGILGSVEAVDQGGETFNCDTAAENGPLSITQNGPANTPNGANAPGQQRG
jgi:hypothetical protein